MNLKNYALYFISSDSLLPPIKMSFLCVIITLCHPGGCCVLVIKMILKIAITDK